MLNCGNVLCCSETSRPSRRNVAAETEAQLSGVRTEVVQRNQQNLIFNAKYGNDIDYADR